MGGGGGGGGVLCSHDESLGLFCLLLYAGVPKLLWFVSTVILIRDAVCDAVYVPTCTITPRYTLPSIHFRWA